MPLQYNVTALIDGGLNRWNVNIRVPRADDDSLGRCCSCPAPAPLIPIPQQTQVSRRAPFTSISVLKSTDLACRSNPSVVTQ
jgi:hypothetical protein